MILNLWVTNPGNTGWRPMEGVSRLDLEAAEGSSLVVKRKLFGSPPDASVSRRGHLRLAFVAPDAVEIVAGETASPTYLSLPGGAQEPWPPGTARRFARAELEREGVVFALGRRFLRLFLTESDAPTPTPTVGPLGTAGDDEVGGRLLDALVSLYRSGPGERLEQARAVVRDVLRAELVWGAGKREKRGRSVFVGRDDLEPVAIRRDPADPFSPPELAFCQRIAEFVARGVPRPPPIEGARPPREDREAVELYDMAHEHLGGDGDPLSEQLREDLVRLAIEHARRLRARKRDEPLPVLALSGDPGVGKNWIVKLLEKMVSSLVGKTIPCEAVNLAAVTPTVAEAELFGVAREAVTGVRERTGAFERANGGILFVDEVGRAVELQKKLFHVLDTGSFFRVGGEATVSVNAIVVVAYNGRATDLIASGAMDEAFAYRLGVPLVVPALTGRTGEVARLARAHLERRQADVPGLDERVLSRVVDVLAARPSWPGNHRQIRDIVDRICDLRRFDDRSVVRVYESTVGDAAAASPARAIAPWSQGWQTVEELDLARDRAICDAYLTLRGAGRTGRAVAQALGTKDPTLRSWIREWKARGWLSADQE